eukprot:6954074-Pyramimonas_sp.AAC.1
MPQLLRRLTAALQPPQGFLYCCHTRSCRSTAHWRCPHRCRSPSCRANVLTISAPPWGFTAPCHHFGFYTLATQCVH